VGYITAARAVTSHRFLVATALCLLCAVARAQDPSPPASNAPEPAAFSLQIQAPDAIKALLERHLDLLRYRALQDLSEAEIQSLLLTAEQDASELVATLGYFSPDIRIHLQAPSVVATGATPTPSPTPVVLIDVNPGPQARVGAVRLRVEGAIAQDPQGQEQRQLVQDLWPLDTGEAFSQAAWDSAKQQALKQLLAKRYPTARVISSRAEVDADAARVALEMALDSGPAFKLGALEVQGPQRYSADLVERFARLRPGADYVQSELVEAQQRLTDSGFYDSAYVNMDVTGDPAHATVHVLVKEATMQKAVFGIGASTDSGARLSAEHTYNQVPGIDWRAVNKVTVSRDNSSFSSDWTSQPGDSLWRWATSALVQQDKVGEIDVNTQRMRAGRFTTDTELDQSYYLQFERTEALYREIDLRNANEAATANYAFALRKFDSRLFPTSGWGLGGELSAGTVMGSEQEPFSRLLLRGLLIQPLGQSESNLFSRQHAGRMVYRAQAGGVFVNNANNVPFSQLFLTGGDTTVRGYKHQEIGVTHDGVLSADSGRYLATAGIEWQRPIVRNGLMTDWETAVFVDTGAVANRVEEFSFKTGVGVGARWKSPIGPLQIDAAYGVATQSFRLHLNVGFVF
jgi:translocation and assembly module TamA